MAPAITTPKPLTSYSENPPDGSKETPRSVGPGGEQSIRSFLHTTARDRTPQCETEAASPTRDSSPSTPTRFSPSPSRMSEHQMSPDGEWRAILSNLLTKADFEALSDRLGRMVREQVAQLRADLSNVEARMSVAEAETRALRANQHHSYQSRNQHGPLNHVGR
ncbi:Hypothetical predicted protein [Pelobates cultripes]|uniref:Uncharacterized protein n=1 Tax=Pelobates cultripes TaxID=61616 RepID=A0AAD1S6F8_PELCU|nr:Hypothetical predicted protein [Pelobates cultripes]